MRLEWLLSRYEVAISFSEAAEPRSGLSIRSSNEGVYFVNQENHCVKEAFK